MHHPVHINLRFVAVHIDLWQMGTRRYCLFKYLNIRAYMGASFFVDIDFNTCRYPLNDPKVKKWPKNQRGLRFLQNFPTIRYHHHHHQCHQCRCNISSTKRPRPDFPCLLLIWRRRHLCNMLEHDRSEKSSMSQHLNNASLWVSLSVLTGQRSARFVARNNYPMTATWLSAARFQGKIVQTSTRL